MGACTSESSFTALPKHLRTFCERSSITSPSDHPRRNIHPVQSYTSPPPSVAPSTPSSPKSRSTTPTHTISQPPTLIARPSLPGPSNSTSSPSGPSSSPPVFRSHSRRLSAGATGNSESALGDIITNTASYSPTTSVQTLTQVLAQSQLHPGAGVVGGGQSPPKSPPKRQGVPPADPHKPVFHAFAATTLSETTVLYIAVTPPVNTLHNHSLSGPSVPSGRASLALVAMLYNNIWQEKRGLIEYNSVFLRCVTVCMLRSHEYSLTSTSGRQGRGTRDL